MVQIWTDYIDHMITISESTTQHMNIISQRVTKQFGILIKP
jgi:hypothetical protein